MQTWAAIWVAVGGIAFAVDMYVWYLRLSGALGAAIQKHAVWYVELNGGCRQVALTMLFASFVCPIGALACCLTTLYSDRKAYKLAGLRGRG
jgi:hypothetical protein